METKGITTMTLKKINKEKVYQFIYEKRETSKLQIVQELGMGLSTVSQNLTALEQEGLIERNGYFESTGGRKAQIIRIVPEVKLSIGIGLLKDQFHIAAVNLYGEIVASHTIPFSYRDTSDCYARITEEILRFIETRQYAPEKILGVSIATQGILSPDGSRVIYGVAMDNLNMKLADFSSRLPYPCHLEHDSKAAAHFELWNHPGLDSAVVFLLNRNLGGAVITNHTVHQGTAMHSGVLEHMCVRPDGPVCYCGSRGCLETYCSVHALEQAANVSIKEFFPLLRAGKNSTFAKIWQEYLEHLAFAMKNVNLILDAPIIISGDLAPYFTQDDLDTLVYSLNSSTPFSFAGENLLVGAHGQYTPAAGAALFYIKQFLNFS